MEHLPNIDCGVAPHNWQRYPTAGDYHEDTNGHWHFNISQLPNWRYEAAILIHELVEAILTKANDVSWDAIDAFDTTGEGAGHPDPGTLKSAPYYKEHSFATKIEKMFCKELGINWEEYNATLDALHWR